VISPEILMLMLELRATSSGLPYTSQPLSEARRHAQRLIFTINALSIPALIFAALGLGVFLSGKAPPLVGLIELIVIGLIIGVQVVLYRRLARLRQIGRADITAYQDDWLLIASAEELVESKSRKALAWTAFGFIPFLTVAAAPFGIVYAAEVLQLIRYLGVGEGHRTEARLLIAINVTLMLIYASLLALLPLLLIRAID
jgi:hypothetical protein